MMNELLELGRQLKSAGVTVLITHADVERAGKSKKRLTVRIDEAGCPISYYETEPGVFFRHSQRNAHAFPVIIMKNSLCDPDHHPKKTNGMQALSTAFPLNTRSNEIILSKWTEEQLGDLCQANEELKSLGALMERFPKTNEETQQFNRALVALIQDDIERRPALHGLVRSLFFTKDPKVQIIFDVAEAHKYAYSVLDPELWKVLQRKLRERDSQEDERRDRGISYLSGRCMVIETIKTPDPTLPVLGSSFVYTRTSETRYLRRYGLNGMDFHMGRQEIAEVVDVLRYILQDAFEGHTWKALPGQNAASLLIAYVEQHPYEGLADLLGGSDEFYREVVERVTEQFQDRFQVGDQRIPPNQPKFTIRLLVIGKVDDARKQVMLNRQYDAADVIRSAERWLMHFKNCPAVDFDEKGGCLNPLYPMDIARLAQTTWKTRSDGKQRSKKIFTIKLGDLYDLYIPPTGMAGYEELCRELLAQFVRQGWDFIGYAGHVARRKERKKGIRGSVESLVTDARGFLGIYIVLLEKLEISKEETMTSVAFLLGQVLKAMDILHEQYCRVNSPKNPLPPRLLGNTYYEMAYDRPLDAVGLLQKRTAIYLAWAKSTDIPDNTTNATTEQITAAKEVLRQLEYVTGTASFTKSEFENWGNEQRAQLMLGYLARLQLDTICDKEEEEVKS